MPRRERPLDDDGGPLVRLAEALRELRTEAGRPTYRELARLAGFSSSTLSAAAAGRQLPSLTVLLAFVRACGAEPGPWEERWRATAAELCVGDSADVETPGGERQQAPYAGLVAFRAEDAPWFFGRRRQIEQLAEQVGRRRFTAVVGASGAGKSSLLHAGFVPAWRAEHPEGQVVTLTPGPRPLAACLKALRAPEAANRTDADTPVDTLDTVDAGAMRDAGAGDDDPVGRAARRLLDGLRPESAELLLVVDQFEETFTLCEEPEEAARFIAALLAAAHGPGSRCRIVVSLRADFYAHCTDHPGLADVMREDQVLVGALTTEELRQVICGPAARAGLTVESALLAELVARAQGRSAVLPLLSHALRETWRRRRGNALTLAAFEATGGMEEALARTAEQAYAALDPARRRTARDVLLRLTAPGDGAEDVKRRVRRTELELCGGDPGPVLEHFARARLLVLDHDTVEIAHETLIRRWPRLRDWLAEDREGLRVHRELAQAARQWAAVGRDTGALYRGVRLDRAHVWASARDFRALSGDERDFLTASLRARSRERAAALRERRRLRGLLALVSALLAGALAATGIAVGSRQEATRQRDRARSQQMAQQAGQLRRTDPAQALRLALAGYRTRPTAAARGTLLSMYATPYARQLKGDVRVEAVAFGPRAAQADVLATGDADGVLRIWDASGPRPRPVAVARGRTALRSLAFSPDGALLASADARGEATLWLVGPEGRLTRRAVLTPRSPAGFDGPAAVAFSPDGRHIAVAGPGGAVSLFPNPAASTGTRTSTHTATGTAPATGSDRVAPRATLGDQRRGYLQSVAVGADGRSVAATGPGGTAVWHLDRAWTYPDRPVRQLPAADSLAFAPHGNLLATAEADRTVRVRDLSGGRPRTTAELTGPTDRILALSFSPDGRTLAGAGVDPTIRLWDLAGPGGPRPPTGPDPAATPGTPPTPTTPATPATPTGPRAPAGAGTPVQRPLSGHTGYVTSIAFSRDGRTLATGGNDRTTRLWDLPGPALAGHSSSVYAVAFSPDGRTLATGSYDRTVRLWRVAGRHERPEAVLGGHDAAVNSVAFAPHGRLLASGSLDRTLRIWDVGGPRPPRRLARVVAGSDAVNGVAFAPDGRRLATAGGDRTLRIWDISTPDRPRQLAVRTAHRDELETVAFSPDGRTLATGGRDRTVRLWDVGRPDRPRPLAVLRCHHDAVKTLAYSPDGRTLASGGDDRRLCLWDTAGPADRPQLLTSRGDFPGAVKALAFTPDGRFLYTASDDAVRQWDVRDRRSPAEWAGLRGHGKPVDALAVSPDGRTLATGSEDWTALLWDTDPERVARRVCRTTDPADLTAADWHRYLPGLAPRPPCPAGPRER
ncbi:AAA family ATPase [Streptomyces sp. NPDC018057]|uniref:nSTAND1 domain-containing NTPase n=1 Tax=unclassified Streptomyces TaxID=2593676 RepID=UPI0037B73350